MSFNKKEFHTLDEVAKIFRVNPRTVFRLIHGQNEKGIRLPATKVGRSWRITDQNLKSFLLQNANIRNAISFREITDPIKLSKIKKK